MIVLFNKFGYKIREHDKFIIYLENDNVYIESHFSEETAKKCVDVLNEHNKKRGYSGRFNYAPIDSVLIEK